MNKIILLILLTVSTNVFSDVNYMTGETLINFLRSSNSEDNIIALGYIFGVIDTHSEICDWKLAGVTGTKLVQITKNHLEKHPESWNYSASAFVKAAISEKYPCKK